jgi:glycosyltransferase involved in cell wall biosynthesis
MNRKCIVERQNGTPASSLTSATAIVIPAYNEARHLENVLRACFAIEPLFMVVVDDASTDETPNVMAGLKREYGPRLLSIRNNKNLGKQGSVKRGLAAVVPFALDAVVLIDGDGQHLPAELPRLVSLLADFDMVIGARSHDEMPVHRRFSNWLVNTAFHLIGGVNFIDLQSGLRVYRKDLADRLAVGLGDDGGYGLEHESMTLLIQQARARGEVLRVAVAAASCRYGVAESWIGPLEVMQLAYQTVYQGIKFRDALEKGPASVVMGGA